jgi:hypothetical protein
MANKSLGKRRMKKNVTDHVSVAAKNKVNTPPGYVMCTNRVIKEESNDICVLVCLVFSSNRHSQELRFISECARSYESFILLLLIISLLLLLLILLLISLLLLLLLLLLQ